MHFHNTALSRPRACTTGNADRQKLLLAHILCLAHGADQAGCMQQYLAYFQELRKLAQQFLWQCVTLGHFIYMLLDRMIKAHSALC